MKNRRFFTYIYLDPRKSGRYPYKDVCFLYEPVYVGKGQGERHLDHLKSRYLTGKKNNYFKNKLLKILESGFEISNIEKYILIFRNRLLESEAFRWEKRLIKQIGRADLKKGPLTNLTDGGDGTSGCHKNKGKVRSAETREKLRQANLGKKWSPQMREKMEGKTHSEEQNQKIANALKGRKKSEEHVEKVRLANLGKKRSEEAKEKNRQAHLGKKVSEETKQKMRGKRHTEEQKRKISESLKGRKYADQYGEKVRQAKLGTKLSEQTKEKIRQAHLRKRISEETKRKMSEAHKRAVSYKHEQYTSSN